MSKGISLPLNMVSVLVVIVLVLIVMASFFTLQSGTQISRSDAQRIFSTECTQLCSADSDDNYRTAARVSEENPEFVEACTALGHIEEGSIFVSRCLKACPCDLSTSTEENNLLYQKVSNDLS